MMVWIVLCAILRLKIITTFTFLNYVSYFIYRNFVIVCIQVELNPEKQLKITSGFFLRVNISTNQMIIGNSKGVNNRHLWFSSITSLGKGCNGHYTYMASPLEMYFHDFETFLAGQAVLQMSQISRLCVIASMSY